MKKRFIYLIIFVLLIIFIFFTFYPRNVETFDNNKPVLKLKIQPDFKNLYLSNHRYSFQSNKQFIDLALPKTYNYVLVNDNEKADITIYDKTVKDKNIMNKDEINVLFTVENLPWWSDKIANYDHYNNYGDYGNENIDIYFYSHISKINKNPDFVAVPMIYNYINYYIENKDVIKPSKNVKFQDKKFALTITKCNLNSEVEKYKNKLEQIGTVDFIGMYDEYIAHTSCYYSQELIDVFNQYKFIVCFENSYQDGYTTEKIFNCLFAHTIPIYKGDPNIASYINKESFVDANDTEFMNTIKLLNSNQDLYEKMVNSLKISNDFTDNDSSNKVAEFINTKLQEKGTISTR